MQLASRLRQTTLGDLLAELHRAGASGVLELIEPHARHAIHLRRGLVQAVESDTTAARLGDVAARSRGVPRPLLERARLLAHARGLRIGQALVAARVITPADLDALLETQQRERLERLFAVPDADVRFRVTRPLPPGASEQTPLRARDVFFGRPRRRATTRVAGSARANSATASSEPGKASPLMLLGLVPGASPEEIRAAYKSRVFALHPDRAMELPEAERTRRARDLIQVIAAYRELKR